MREKSSAESGQREWTGRGKEAMVLSLLVYQGYPERKNKHYVPLA